MHPAGAYLILGRFGSGKSFYTHLSVTGGLHSKKYKPILITNYSTPDAQIEFRSISDLILILSKVYAFKKDPANRKIPIHIVVDEAPLYFGSREFKTFPKELYPFLNQLRKLNVSLFLICQKADQLDVMCRRVVNTIYKYDRFLMFIRLKNEYDSVDDQCNILDPISTEKISTFPKLGIHLTLLWHKVFNEPIKVCLNPLLKPFGYSYAPPSSKYDTGELIIPTGSYIYGDLDFYFPKNKYSDMSPSEYYQALRARLV